MQLGQLRANHRLQQPTLLDVTGVRDLGINKPLGSTHPHRRVPSKEPTGVSELDEVYTSYARDLVSRGKFPRAFDQAELITDPTYRAAVVRYIHAAQHRQRVN